MDQLMTPEEKRQLIKCADQVCHGKILCFSRWLADYGYPIDWHQNPVKRISWPTNLHWSKVVSSYKKTHGDIKLTWEINRFSYVFVLVRAYALTGDSKWVSIFLDHLKTWESGNPYGMGVNWNSGQELAIRMLAWIFGLFTFNNDPAFTAGDFERIQRLLYCHAFHINKNISFARYAVQNNHLIGEALALYAIGSLFPWFRESSRWKHKGKKLLENECLKQFYEDGGYCQSSHNYHRLALSYYLWACRIGECLNDQLSMAVYKTIERSSEYLASFINVDGRLPNWGANDGASLTQLNSCDYADFRPLLTSLRYLISANKAFKRGQWDEELVWFFGLEAVDARVKPYQLRSASFPISGIHVLRKSERDFIVLRCGSVIDRFGQADQLHVDLWWRGLNLAIDGGSYLYNDELQYHEYFMGTRSHNTMVVDDEDQMRLHRRFKWLDWTSARLLRFDPALELLASIMDIGERGSRLLMNEA
jgi:asparagine synthase (glutamine-hydrolysing)